MEAIKPVTILGAEKNKDLILGCMEDAQKQIPDIFQRAPFFRKIHNEGQKNSSSPASAEGALDVGKHIIENFTKERRKGSGSVRLFGEHISEAAHTIKSYFRG